jgi:hypothetical protein
MFDGINGINGMNGIYGMGRQEAGEFLIGLIRLR